MSKNKNNSFKLGRSIAQIVPFQRIPIKKQQQKEIITSKLVIIMVIIAVVKIAVLILMDLRTYLFRNLSV
jgi:hypothetical protein